MTFTKFRIPRFLSRAGSRNLSAQLTLIGLGMTLVFVVLALLAPVMQAWGLDSRPHRLFDQSHP